MQQSVGSPSVPVGAEENLTDMVSANAERFADAVSFRRRVDGSWLDVTARDFAAHVRAVAAGLVAAGLVPGDRVVLLCAPRYEWSLLEFAAWTAGCVTVSVPAGASAEQTEHVLSATRAKALVVDTAAHRRTVAGALDRLADLGRVWQLDPDGDPAVAPAVDELTALGADLDDTALRTRRLAVRADDVASIAYTAGVTGQPKGVVLTHGTLLTQARGLLAALPTLLRPGQSTLVSGAITQPTTRALALACVHARSTLGHLPDTMATAPGLVSELGTFRPTFLVTVPRVLERVYASVAARARVDGTSRVFDTAADVAVRHAAATAAGNAPGLRLRTAHAVAARLVYPRVRSALGGRCTAVVCVGGRLDDQLTDFFRGTGVPVLHGYGTVEAGLATVDPIGTSTSGARDGVGLPLPGVSVRVAPDGAVLLAGDAVSTRYWPAEHGVNWLATGDLGGLDDAGYLSVRGREQLETSTGLRVEPTAVENATRRHPLVAQCVLVGDGRPELAALIVVDTEVAGLWFTEHEPGTEPGTEVAPTDPRLRGALRTALDDAERATGVRVPRLHVLTEPLTEAAGELTPSRVPRRDVIAKTRANDLAALYR